MVLSRSVGLAVLAALLQSVFVASAFTCQSRVSTPAFARQRWNVKAVSARTNESLLLISLRMSDDNSQEDGVVELADDEDVKDTPPPANESAEVGLGAPFLSQGEILPESLNPDLSDPKQTRVILYILISLVPVLFLIPLMMNSRDLIPLTDMEMPPVIL